MWSEYFPFAKIIGLDKEIFKVDPKESRIEYRYFNANSASKFKHILCKDKPHVIIDDASQIFKHQQDTFFSAFQTLTARGIYIIEDLNSVQGRLIAGFDPTKKVFKDGVSGLRKCRSYLKNPEEGELVVSEIASITFSKSLQSGKDNILSVSKKNQIKNAGLVKNKYLQIV